ncbi:MAG: FTR1 family protein [Clostridiales bacterium]|nr:FTR1 family protein [Clostridiales bacterium]
MTGLCFPPRRKGRYQSRRRQRGTTTLKGKVQGSVAKSSLFSLAFAAFLAVFREGTEIILFYMALLANAKSDMR